MPKRSVRRPRLTQQERHAQILALLRREGIVRIATLARTFDVTTETARRDLDELAESGALKRTYGGGASRSLIDEPGIGPRGLVHAQERTRIAAAAAALVESGDVVMGMNEGRFSAEHIVAELGEVVNGAEGRRSDIEVTIFKSLGMAVEDVTAADLAYRRASERGIGLELTL